jgi:hypothetical protein
MASKLRPLFALYAFATAVVSGDINGFITLGGEGKNCPFASCAMNAVATNGSAYFRFLTVLVTLTILLRSPFIPVC